MASELGGGGGGLVFSTTSCREGGKGMVGCRVGVGRGRLEVEQAFLPTALEQTFIESARLHARHCLAFNTSKGVLTVTQP